MKELIEYLKNEIRLITLAILLLGFLNYYLHYIHFGINISSYLDASEIIFSFSSIFYALVSTAAFVAVYTQTTRIPEIVNLIRPQKTRSIKHLIIRLIIIGGLTLLIFNYVWMPIREGFSLALPRKESQNDAVLFSIFFILEAVVYVTLNAVREKDFIKELMVYSLIVFSTFMIVDNYFFYRFFAQNEMTKHIRIELTNEAVLETNDSIRLIGSTRNFYFFRNIYTSENVIIPMSSISTLKEQAPDSISTKNKSALH